MGKRGPIETMNAFFRIFCAPKLQVFLNTLVETLKRIEAEYPLRDCSLPQIECHGGQTVAPEHTAFNNLTWNVESPIKKGKDNVDVRPTFGRRASYRDYRQRDLHLEQITNPAWPADNLARPIAAGRKRSERFVKHERSKRFSLT